MKKYYYLIYIQFLGFRYSGWQKQTNSKTVQEMIDRTFRYFLKHENFKTLASGRTDAKVSANNFTFELFIDREYKEDELLSNLNSNLPADINVLKVIQVNKEFNIMNDSKTKKYHYYFSNEKFHPFAASLMSYFEHSLDFSLMKEGAKLFEGQHNFKNYCFKPNDNTNFFRSVDFCELSFNDIHTASFFPNTSYVLKVYGQGFMRQQIRIMMGTLINLGEGKISLNDIKESLKNPYPEILGFIAPASGLILEDIIFEL